MPVEDHPVHPSTVQKPTYGCVNRPAAKMTLTVKDGLTFTSDGKLAAFKMKEIPFVGSLECMYDFSATDARCGECCHRESMLDHIEKNGR